PERAAELSAKYGIQATAGCNREAAAQADLIVLAVKPGTLPKVVTEIRDALTEQKILLSLAASVPISLIEKLAGRRMPIFRAMPKEADKQPAPAPQQPRPQPAPPPAARREKVPTPAGAPTPAPHELERPAPPSMPLPPTETDTRHSEERTRALESKTDQ